MDMSKKDLRIQKTQKFIRTSFVELMAEKGFENITINDISEKAMINRSTFYLHYTDKYDLLNQIVDQAIEKLITLVAPETHIQNNILEFEGCTQNIQVILKTIAEDALLYKTMLEDSKIPDVRKRITDTLKHKLSQSFHGQTLITEELFIELITSLYMGAITWWLNHEMMYSPSYMADQMIKMLTMAPVHVGGLVNEIN